MNVAIISYGTGNIASLKAAINSLKANPYLAENIQDLKKADKIILPGVGHFTNAAQNLEDSGLKKYLLSLIYDGIPTLGICLGFQLLTCSSEESESYPGLGLLPLSTTRIKVKNTILNKVPHMGWNTIYNFTEGSKLLKGINLKNQIFYYSNAYSIVKSNSIKIPHASYMHEIEMIAIAEYKNIFGVQFHPEKSRSQGLTILRNFLNQ